MPLEYIVRGNVVSFAATFLDADGNDVEPDSVQLTVSFLDADGDRQTDTIAMEQDTNGDFVAEWDSSDASRCRVFWAVRTEDPASADEGFFELSANLANPNPV